jgi:uncharacterized short protein YbdD (DUF466 family)
MSKVDIKKIGGYKEEIEEAIEEPLDDSEIRHYLPDAKIMTYKELSKYRHINELLPEETDYVIILYLDAPNKGHWTAVLKYKNIYEMFDPYGVKELDEELKWTPCPQRIKLGVAIPYLTRLFNTIEKPYKGILSTFEYQDDKMNINSCGKHCVFRILKLLDNQMNIQQYYNYMKGMRKKFNLSYDEIVATMIAPEIDINED